MRTVFTCIIKTILIVLIGGFVGATLVRFAPGYGVSEQELDSRLNRDSLQALRQSQTPPDNLMSFYARYWGKALHGDFGFSTVMQQPVRQLLVERFPETIKSVGFGLALGWIVGLGLAILSVTAHSATVGRGMSLLATAAICVPAAVLALLCVMARAPGRLVIAIIVFPKVFQYARNLLVRSAALPHVLAASARGLNKSRIFLRHILPVSAPQLLAVAGVTVSMAFTAAIPVEALCDLPGIGQLAWKAALGRDLELLIVLTIIVTTITFAANSTADFLGNNAAHR